VPGYEILEQLGHGGMGVVYKARQRQLNRLVALKMIRAGSQAPPQLLSRFRIEAEAVARLRHPNIVQIFDIGDVDGLPYFSLELLEGGSLAARLAGTPQPPRQAAEMVITLARAVHTAHRAGIVHRDLKPLNVLFDTDGAPKITDFGLAKRLEQQEGQTETGQVLGSPSYMAPEQASGRSHEVGPLADLYSLGAIFYEMLTGRPPFKGTTPSDTVYQVLHQEPVPPSRLQPKLPRDIETICLKCLAKEPHKRYADADALAADLGRYLAGEPIRARRTPFWERGLKWSRRHPMAATLLAVAVVLATGLTGAAARYNAYVRDQSRRRDEHIAKIWLESSDELMHGREQLARGDLAEARESLILLLTKIQAESPDVQAEPRLFSVRQRSASVLDEVNRNLSEQATQRADRLRYADFARKHDDALFFDMQYSDLDAESKIRETRTAARAALDVFGARDRQGDWRLKPLPSSLSKQEHDDVTSGCFELLMILAEAEAQVVQGEEPRNQAEQALRILDEALTLRAPTRAYRMRRAACLARLGDTAAAARERGEAEQLPPQSAFDHFLTGQERYKRGDWSEAIVQFDAALQIQPELFWAQCLLAICSMNSHPARPDVAKAALTACVQLRPQYAWIYLLRGSAYGQMGALARADATRLPARAAELRDEAEAHFDAAEGDFARALDHGLNADLRYTLFMNRGVMRFQRHTLAEATADLEQAIKLDDHRYNAFEVLANVYREQGRRADAIAQLDTAIRLGPEVARLYRERAQARLNESGDSPTTGDAEAALGDLDASIQREEPGSRSVAEDQVLRARLLFAANRYADALAVSEAALAIAPELAQAQLLRVSALLELKRFDDVIRLTDAQLGLAPPSASVYQLRALAREGRNEFAGAIDDYTHALALQPSWAQLHVYRGWAYLFSNATDLALRDFDEAVRLQPEKPDGYSGRGAARVRLRLCPEAVSDVEKAVRLGVSTPGLSRLLYNAARVYAQAATIEAFDRRRDGRSALQLSTAYEARALALLRQTLARLPAGERADFFREVIAPDQAFAALRRNQQFERLTSVPSPMPQ
jgi:eukaryotic-like serine/threonine-protein kinase